jgi:hypothetical protein
MVLNQFNSNPGAGDWGSFDRTIEDVYAAAEDWRIALQGVDRPWLCWNVSPRWTLLQQRLIQAVGWTPVVGWDPRYPAPPLAPGAIAVDFNARFNFPIMYFHFPVEFVFRFTDRLAFWHSDLLCRLEVMETLARRFEALKDGQTAAVRDTGGRRYVLTPKRHRYWELVGCTTRGASRSQFEAGAGWWRPFFLHPNCPPAEKEARSKYLGDHGFGVMYWKRECGGDVVELELKPLLEGHCTSINRPDYKRIAPDGPERAMGHEIDLNYKIEDVARNLGIAHLLD